MSDEAEMRNETLVWQDERIHLAILQRCPNASISLALQWKSGAVDLRRRLMIYSLLATEHHLDWNLRM